MRKSYQRLVRLLAERCDQSFLSLTNKSRTVPSVLEAE